MSNLNIEPLSRSTSNAMIATLRSFVRIAGAGGISEKNASGPIIGIDHMTATVRACLLLALALLMPLCAYAASTQHQSDSNNPAALKILFIGHSIFFWHDAPGMFCSIAKDMNPNQPLKVETVVGDAYSLEKHMADGTALRAIKKDGPWDYVVLFEQTGAAEARPQVYERCLRLLDAEIKAAHGKTVLIENYNDSFEEDADTRATYAEFASKYQASVIPLGTVWSFARKQYPDLDLYDQDSHHPSTKGTFLLASLLYSYFLGQGAPGRISTMRSPPAADCNVTETEHIKAAVAQSRASAPSITAATPSQAPSTSRMPTNYGTSTNYRTPTNYRSPTGYGTPTYSQTPNRRPQTSGPSHQTGVRNYNF